MLERQNRRICSHRRRWRNKPNERTNRKSITINALCALLKNYRDSHGWLFRSHDASVMHSEIETYLPTSYPCELSHSPQVWQRSRSQFHWIFLFRWWILNKYLWWFTVIIAQLLGFLLNLCIEFNISYKVRRLIQWAPFVRAKYSENVRFIFTFIRRLLSMCGFGWQRVKCPRTLAATSIWSLMKEK